MRSTSVSGEGVWVDAFFFFGWYACQCLVRNGTAHQVYPCNFPCNVSARMQPSRHAQHPAQRATTSRARRPYTYLRTNVVSYRPVSPSPYHMGM